jgi:hypothetical protein
MVRPAEAAARNTKLAELKRLITSHHYESLEKLEEAVDALLWGDSEVAQLTCLPEQEECEIRLSGPNRPR